MRFVSVFAVLYPIAASVPVAAQACDSTCITVLEVASAWVAKAWDVPYAEIVVDTTRGGYGPSAVSGGLWQRTVGTVDLQRLSSRLGMRLAAPREVLNCNPHRPSPTTHCAWIIGKALVVFNALRAAADTASIIVDVNAPPVQGARANRYGMYELRFRKTETGWRLESVAQVGWS